ncbi:MAG: response regulator [Nitrospinae bacterium]|nr:response regulator [Nitrospinota bacterium]
MKPLNITILIVEGDPLYREVVKEYLKDESYIIKDASNGTEAWELLDSNPEEYDIVLLDDSLPGMKGMDVIKKMKANPILENIPVIIESGKIERREINRGMKAGAYYYLTKPYKKDILLAVLMTAVGDRMRFKRLKEEVMSSFRSLAMIDTATYFVQNLQGAQALAEYLSKIALNSEQIVTGLSELFINAVEHGNLGITYEEKSILSKDGEWLKEVEKRLNLPENCSKKVEVTVKNLSEHMVVTIKDEGKGFDWKKYMKIDTDRIYHQHGRGIAIARMVSFERMHYNEKGNEIEITIKKKK